MRKWLWPNSSEPPRRCGQSRWNVADSGDAGREVLRDALVDDESVGGGAGLADVAELRRERPFHGLVQVGVVEYDERRVAAEFHRHTQHVAGGLGDKRAADLGGTGERQLP